MLHETFFARQLSVFTPDQARSPVTIIGCGAVGSMTALALAKIGCANLTLYDPDTVEDLNVPPQMFHPGQVGHNKAFATAANLKHFMDSDSTAHARPWDFGTWQETPLVVVAVDSMATRKSIYEQLRTRLGLRLVLEARMGLELARLYAFKPGDPDHQKKYEKTLYSDDEAAEPVCTARAISYTTFTIAGLLASLVKHELTGGAVPFELIFDMASYGIYSSGHA